MKILRAVIVVFVVGLTGLLTLAVGPAAPNDPVVPNDGVPEGLPPRAWACYPTCILPSYIVTDDFDVDGWLELAVACIGTGDVWGYDNNGGVGPGLFRPLPPLPAVPNPVGMVTGQFRAAGAMPAFDGFPDVAVLSGFTGAVGVMSGGAALLAGSAPAVFGPVAGAICMAGGNFDNDARLDFVVAAAGSVQVFYSSTGYVPNPVLPLGVAGVPVSVVTGDFDQNGWDDVAVLVSTAKEGGGAIVVFYNLAVLPPAFSPRALFGAGPGYLVPAGMDVGDFNADGYPDLVIIENSLPVADEAKLGFAQVFLNSVPVAPATRGFVPQANGAMSTWGFNARFVEAFDADGNHRDDFAVANWGSDTVTVFLTDGFALGQDYRATDAGYCLCDEQRKKELLDITFKLFKIELKCGHFPVGLAAGDYDRNGKMDLAVALQSADEKLCAQNPSCIEIDFDIACGFSDGQTPHGSLPGVTGEKTTCPNCKDSGCLGNTPPSAEIKTGSEPKKP